MITSDPPWLIRSDVLIFYKNVLTDSLWLIFARFINILVGLNTSHIITKDGVPSVGSGSGIGIGRGDGRGVGSGVGSCIDRGDGSNYDGYGSGGGGVDDDGGGGKSLP